MEGLTLNEIELKLFLLKKRTKKAIEKNEATILRLERASHERNDFLASLEGLPPPVLKDDSLYNTDLSSYKTETSSSVGDPEPQVEDSSSSDRSSFDESRDDGNSNGSDGIEEEERHNVEQDSSSSSYESSVTTTASSTASRMEAFLQLEAAEERRVLARLDHLRSNLRTSDELVAARRSAR